jgi:hypothetical protein
MRRDHRPATPSELPRELRSALRPPGLSAPGNPRFPHTNPIAVAGGSMRVRFARHRISQRREGRRRARDAARHAKGVPDRVWGCRRRGEGRSRKGQAEPALPTGRPRRRVRLYEAGGEDIAIRQCGAVPADPQNDHRQGLAALRGAGGAVLRGSFDEIKQEALRAALADVRAATSEAAG